MAVLVVRHRTRYRYKQPVRLGQHRLLFRPRDSFDQRLLDSRLVVLPQPNRLRWVHDAFGNCVTLLDFDAWSKTLEIESAIRLDHVPEDAPEFEIDESANGRNAQRISPDTGAVRVRVIPTDEESVIAASSMLTLGFESA